MMLRGTGLLSSLALTFLALASAQPRDGCNSHIDQINEDCPPSGLTFFTNTEHCSRYWECRDGCVHNMVCEFNYLWDDENQWCDFPEKVMCGERDCDGRPCKDEGGDDDGDDDGGVDPNPGCVFDHDHQCGNDGYYPDEDNCIKYYHCYDGDAELCTCDVKDGEQLLWSEEHMWCDYPSNVDCGERPVCDENDENCHDNNIPVDPNCVIDHDYECPADGWYVNEDNCIKYYHCTGEVTQSCTCKTQDGEQLLWSEEHQWCDFPSNVDCGERPICDENDMNCHAEPTPKPNGCQSLGQPCSVNGDIHAEGGCENCFCECAVGTGWLEICCGHDLAFNPSVGYCDYPSNNPACHTN